MKFYLSNFKLRFITELQYRASALAGVVTQFFFGLVFIMVFLAFYESGDSNAPITLSQTVSYLWLNQMLFSLIYLFYTDYEVVNQIREGTIAYELIRPKNLYFIWASKIIGTRLARVSLRILPVLIVAIILPEPYRLQPPSDITTFILFILGLIIGMFLMIAIVNLTNVITVATLDSKGVANIFKSIADILSGDGMPIAFFPLILKKIALILPFSYVSDFPFRIYTNQVTGYSILNGFIIQIIWIILLFIIGILILNKALKRAVVQGG